MKVLILVGVALITIGTLGAQQAQAPLTFPDVVTPSGAQSTAVLAWKSAVETDLNSHETRLQGIVALEQTDFNNLQNEITALQQDVAKLQNGSAPPPPAPTSLTNPTLVAGSGILSGNLITQTNPGTVYNWAFNAPAKTYTVTVTGAGPGSLQPLVNGSPMGTPLQFPASTLGSQSFSIAWPGGTGTLGFSWISGWLNLQTTIAVQ